MQCPQGLKPAIRMPPVWSAGSTAPPKTRYSAATDPLDSNSEKQIPRGGCVVIEYAGEAARNDRNLGLVESCVSQERRNLGTYCSVVLSGVLANRVAQATKGFVSGVDSNDAEAEAWGNRGCDGRS